MENERFGRLILIQFSHKKGSVYYWTCRCDCGVIKQVAIGEMRRGSTKSCGCLKSEVLSSSKMGENNPMWKGDKVKYNSLHEWVRNHLPKPEVCCICKKCPPFDLANISQKYTRNLSDWEYLCRRCHMIKDERIKNFFLNKELSLNGLAPILRMERERQRRLRKVYNSIKSKIKE